jgi:hypothetical protein
VRWGNDVLAACKQPRGGDETLALSSRDLEWTGLTTGQTGRT